MSGCMIFPHCVYMHVHLQYSNVWPKGGMTSGKDCILVQSIVWILCADTFIVWTLILMFVSNLTSYWTICHVFFCLLFLLFLRVCWLLYSYTCSVMCMWRDRWSAYFSFDDFPRILCDDISCCANILGYSRVFVASESVPIMPPLYDDLSWKMVLSFVCAHNIIHCMYVCMNMCVVWVCVCAYAIVQKWVSTFS